MVYPNSPPQDSTAWYMPVLAQFRSTHPDATFYGLVEHLRARSGCPLVEATAPVEHFCASQAPDLFPKPAPEPTLTPVARLFMVLGCASMVLVPYLVYKVLVTPPPTDAPGPEPVSWTVAKGLWNAAFIGLLAFWWLKRKERPPFPVFRSIRPLTVAANVLVIAVIVATSYGLYRAFPFLDRSWLYLIPHNETGATNIGLLPTRIRYVGLAFVLLFAANVPSLAYGEELQYRDGTMNWKHACRRSLRFGLAHCVMGVPVYVGLALSLGGMWFTFQYFRGGVERSTVHHSTYNLIILAVLFAALAAQHLGG